MKFFKFFVKHTKIRYISIPFIKLSTSIVYCDFFSEKKKTQNVYLFGSSLSLPDGSYSHSLFNGKNTWKLINFGPSFGVALDESNNVYLWGINMKDKQSKEYVKPFRIQKINGVIDCQCSNNDIYFLKNDGSVWIIKDMDKILKGEKKPNPEQLTGFTSDLLLNQPKIIKMSIGKYHSAFISDDGSLCKNDYGQCGLRPTILRTGNMILTFPLHGEVELDEGPTDIVDLNQVEFGKGVTIKNVICGLTHTICVDTENNIYAFGDDSSIQLFFGDSRGISLKDDKRYTNFINDLDYVVPCDIRYGLDERHLQYVPVKVNDHLFLIKFKKLIENSNIELAAGDGFTIIHIIPKDESSRDELILSSGKNNYGQCGSLDPITHAARKIKFTDRSRCKYITCGNTHCMALMNSNKVWAWGRNDNNQFNYMRKNNIMIPESVKVYPRISNPQKPKIQYVRCAYENSVIITD